MADVVDKTTRSRMMSGIRGKDTKPEILLRKGLFAKGFRFRLHDRRLPGKPDIVFPRFKAVILAHGCFWHEHNCPLFKWPSSNVKFWKTKIERNREVDRMARETLVARGWRILTVWECALKGPGKLPVGRVVEEAAMWLSSGAGSREVVGREKP
jgi:DNA mismatch endonuclease (patch repair protein)